jgi:NAD(P)-dependent dehydrogenase (short-subunit alcohol dehydrogenase family)
MSAGQPDRPGTKTWFITGASSGIGRHLTELLLARGDRVAATARRVAALDGLAAEYPRSLVVERLDLTDTPAIRTVLAAALGRLGRIDVVVSNAGYGLVGAAEEVTDDQLARQLGTNLVGPMQLARAAIPLLREQGGGRIMQVSSMVPVAIAGLSVYHAAKWGIEGFWEAVIPEIAPFGIGVTIVQPGSARTGFGGSNEVAAELAAYADTPVARRRAKATADTAPSSRPGDALKMAQAIIDCADLPIAPRRLTLGSDAARLIKAALLRQLDELETGWGVAASTDADDVHA